jgi:hypothetical protein
MPKRAFPGVDHPTVGSKRRSGSSVRPKHHNQENVMKAKLHVKSAVKAGGTWRNHNRTLAVRSAVKAGGIWRNHNRRLRAQV